MTSHFFMKSLEKIHINCTCTVKMQLKIQLKLKILNFKLSILLMTKA